MKLSSNPKLACVAASLIGLAGAAGALRAQPPQDTGADSAAVAAAVDRYHEALATGDTAAAVRLLAAEAVILESGGMETKAEYMAHHLPADIAFARAVARERGAMTVTIRGDVAWAASTSRVKGRFRDREIDSRGAELMVLARTPDGWRIVAIHWSSRANR